MASESAKLANVVNQFEQFIRYNWFREDPYMSIIPRKVFENANGVSPKVTSMTGELPTAYPTSLSNINITDGPGASGDVAATAVSTGQTDRTYTLEVDAWRSNVLNISDLDFREQAVSTIKNYQEALAQYTIVRNSDWHRIKNISMMDNKSVVTSAGVLKSANNTASNFDDIVCSNYGTAQAGGATTITLVSTASAVDDTYNTQTIYIYSGTGAGQARTISDYVGATKVATISAAWATNPDATSKYRILNASNAPGAAIDFDEILSYVYEDMARKGGAKFAMGMSDGLATYALCLSPELKRKLFKADLQTNMRYFDGMQNFTARGIDKAMNGFIPNIDLFALRYDQYYNLIYPTINQATTRGFENVQNPDYAPVSLGGKALYEVAYVMSKEIWEARPRASSRTSYERATFKPQNYAAELDFLTPESIDSLGDNNKRNKGYFRCDWQIAARPVRPYLGRSILYKIPSEV